MIERQHLTVALGQAFQQHGCLPLKRHHRLDPEQTRSGIEPAPQTRTLRTVQTAIEHLPEHRCGCLLDKAGFDFFRTPEAMQYRRGHSPRLTRGAITARQRQGCKRTDSQKIGSPGAQQFAPPGSAVAAQPDAVQRQPERRLAKAVFGHHRYQMGVVMLHWNRRQTTCPGKIGGETGGLEVGMQVVRNPLRLDLQDVDQVRDCILKEAAGRCIVEVADVLRNEGLIAARDADRILEPATDRQHRRAGIGQLDGPWRVAACPTNELEAAGGSTNHSIVAAHNDVAIVRQEGIGDISQSLHRFVITDDQRLPTWIGAGHDQAQRLRLGQPGGSFRTTGGFVEQQVLQRCIGQHDAKPRQARRHPRQALIGEMALLEQHDRALA